MSDSVHIFSPSSLLEKNKGGKRKGRCEERENGLLTVDAKFRGIIDIRYNGLVIEFFEPVCGFHESRIPVQNLPR